MSRTNGGPLRDGWIARHRSVREHWLVGHGIHVKPADPSRRQCHTQGEAWEDLLMECRYERGTVNNGGRKMDLLRGEMVGAVSWLANRWNWTPKTVRRFLDQLENDGMIDLKNPGVENGQQKGKQANVISVCNYEYYQNGELPEGQANGQAEGKQGASKGQAEGNNNKDNKGIKETKEEEEKDIRAAEAAPIDEVFDQFWLAFPEERRRGKGKCRDLFRQIARGKHAKRKATAEQMLAAVRAGHGIDPEYPPMPETWLNQGRWEDLPKGAQPAAEDEPEPVNGKKWGWWRGREASIKALPVPRWESALANHPPNGVWPWWVLGPPAGHPECLMPAELVQKHGFAEIYRGKIKHD